MNFQGRCFATGIGSVPYPDPEFAARFTIDNFPQVPFWPQLPRRSELESMNPQISEGFPNITFIDGKLVVNKDEDFFAKVEGILTDGVLVSSAAISDEYASGLKPFLELLPAIKPWAVKGQMSGPVTFGFGIVDRDGVAALDDELLRDLVVKHVIAKAQWQYDRLCGFGVPVLLFLDEPYLASFGTPFFNWDRAEVVEILRSVFEPVKKYAAAGKAPLYIGSHCCANTDWPIFPLSGADIISFDAFNYADKFLLYREELSAFLKSGGNIAWGIVPTDPSDLKDMDSSRLIQIMKELFNRVHGWGLDLEMIASQGLITAACGLGFQPVDAADKAFKLTVEVSSALRDIYSLD